MDNIFSKKEIRSEEDPYQKAEERSQQPASQYSDEYSFLTKLISLVVKQGVPLAEIKALVDQAKPLQTIGDIGDLSARIWTLATTKYSIPRNWLIQKLPDPKQKKSSLKKAEKIELSLPNKVSFNVLIDPSRSELQGLLNTSKEKSLRYVFGENDFFSWDAWFGYHDYVIDELAKLGYEVSPEDEAGFINTKKDIEYIFGNTKQADLWTVQESAESSTTPPTNYYAYQYGQDRDITVSGPKDPNKELLDKVWDIIVTHFFANHERWSNVIQEIKKIYPSLSNDEIKFLRDQVKLSLDKQMGFTAKKKHGLSLVDVLKILETKDPKPTHIDYDNNVIEFTDGSKLSFDEATKKALEINKKSDKLECPKCHSANIEEYNG